MKDMSTFSEQMEKMNLYQLFSVPKTISSELTLLYILLGVFILSSLLTIIMLGYDKYRSSKLIKNERPNLLLGAIVIILSIIAIFISSKGIEENFYFFVKVSQIALVPLLTFGYLVYRRIFIRNRFPYLFSIVALVGLLTASFALGISYVPIIFIMAPLIYFQMITDDSQDMDVLPKSELAKRKRVTNALFIAYSMILVIFIIIYLIVLANQTIDMHEAVKVGIEEKVKVAIEEEVKHKLKQANDDGWFTQIKNRISSVIAARMT
ncbi:hypothetical protein NEFER03_1185 [Nematocida sp. LUAm3]|nr:hypothetical protein NEFER03_1185 [Nematocida sp. LUAm3]KAI5175794.1 hypothetical protein NEFER02_1663 [Nematocida sp. LUAm2]KAI5178290.1 hypothetical protein NEFER01_1457 [Nematocida sp. LUAm1]